MPKKKSYKFVNKNHTHRPNNFSFDSNNSNKFTALHQNIRGISNKIDEFLISLPPNAPQVICLTEHHMKTEGRANVNFGQYTLGSAYCRQTYKQGGVCIYISKNISFKAINLDQYIKEKDFEICALKICEVLNCFTVICIYRSPTGDFNYFLNYLESILHKTCKPSSHIILCGDVNINYLDDNTRKHILDSLLASFGLFNTVKFPTRIFH
jgi:exonuclease III